MRALRRRRQLALFLVIVAVVALTVVGAAYALTASSFKYSSPKTGYVRVSHMDFTPDASGDTWADDWTSGLTSSSGECLNAGVDLPAGSHVKSITFYYKSGPASDFFGRFLRTELATGVGVDLIPDAQPADDSGSPHAFTSTIAPAKQGVTAGRAFGIGVCPGSDGTFYGAKVKYTYTSAGS